MAKVYSNILKYGTQANYNAIETKDSSVLYFCTDTKKIYKGTIDFTDSVVFAATKPNTPIVGKLYIIADTGTAEVYNGSAWTVVSYPTVTSLSASSTDVQVPSAKSVYDFVTGLVDDLAGSSNVVKSIASKSGSNGTITVTKADNSTSDVALTGVVTDPVWNSSTRVLTLPVVGGTAVEVNIGKDIFLDTTANNRYDTTDNSIHLYLNDGTGSSDATEIVIPASDLIDVYTGGTTTSATASVSAGNEITVNVRLKANVAAVAADPENGVEAVAGFTNALQIDAVSGGLYVDLSNYYTKSEVDALLNGVGGDVTALASRVTTAEGAITTLNGDNTTTGSVAKAVKDAVDDLKANEIKDAQDAADAAQADADALRDDLDALEIAVGWGTF